MKTLRIIAFGLLLWMALIEPATVCGQVGFYKVGLSIGDNLIGVPLWDPLNETVTLNRLFNSAHGMPDNAVAYLWDSTTGQFGSPSFYSLSTGWSIDYEVKMGVGLLIHSPVDTNLVILGAVRFTNELAFSGNGLFLVTPTVPFNISYAEFFGRDPFEGEWISRLDRPTQTYYTNSFLNGTWDNGVPVFQPGEGVFVNLVPEPTSNSLLGIAAIAFGAWRYFRIGDEKQK